MVRISNAGGGGGGGFAAPVSGGFPKGSRSVLSEKKGDFGGGEDGRGGRERDRRRLERRGDGARGRRDKSGRSVDRQENGGSELDTKGGPFSMGRAQF